MTTLKKIRNGIRWFIYNDKIFNCINYVVLTILLFMVLYPVIYVVSSSFSSPTAVTSGRVWFLPVDFSLMGYKEVLEYKDVWTGYANTIFYTAASVVTGLTFTVLGAYPLSKKDMPFKGLISLVFVFTMWFGGGLIPGYLWMRDLGLLDTRFVIFFPLAVSVYNMIVLRTAFQTGLPSELYDSARIDGCSEWRYLLKIALPLSKATLVVLGMFYGLGMWNAYFGPFIYLSSRSKYPLQNILREILVVNQIDINQFDPSKFLAMQMTMTDAMNMVEVLKYAIIVLATLPLVIIYPFLQRYFAKGMMVGAIKG